MQYRKIRIEAPPTGQDTGYGTPTGAWTTFATLWAEVQEVLPSKGESIAEGIRIAQRPARIRTRSYVDGITSDMRVVLLDRGDRLLKILTPPVELGRRAGLEFMAADFSTAGNAA